MTYGITWVRKRDFCGDWEYLSSNGARVYKYVKQPFKPQEWGVQLHGEKSGSGGFTSLRDAKDFVSRHGGPSNDQLMAVPVINTHKPE